MKTDTMQAWQAEVGDVLIFGEETFTLSEINDTAEFTFNLLDDFDNHVVRYLRPDDEVVVLVSMYDSDEFEDVPID